MDISDSGKAVDSPVIAVVVFVVSIVAISTAYGADCHQAQAANQRISSIEDDHAELETEIQTEFQSLRQSLADIESNQKLILHRLERTENVE